MTREKVFVECYLRRFLDAPHRPTMNLDRWWGKSVVLRHLGRRYVGGSDLPALFVEAWCRTLGPMR